MIYFTSDIHFYHENIINSTKRPFKNADEGAHYPLTEWNKYYRGAFHLHGHQHNNSLYNYENLQKGLRKYDVGVDANNFKPISVDEILKFFEKINLKF